MEQIQILLRDRDEGASNDCASSGLKAPCVLYVRNANKIQLPVMARCSSPCIFLIKQTWVIGPGHCLCMKPLALTSILDLTITPSARKLLQLKERERTDENYVIHNSRSAILLSICVCVCVQLFPTLSDPMDHSQPGSSVHGIFQARILEWVAIFLL